LQQLNDPTVATPQAVTGTAFAGSEFELAGDLLGAVDLAVNWKTTPGRQIAQKVPVLALDITSNAVNIAANVTGSAAQAIAAPALALPVSAYVATKTAMRLHSARTKKDKLAKLVAKGRIPPKLQKQVDFIKGQMTTKLKRSIGLLIGSGLGVAGGVVALLAACGVAAAVLGPVGWAIGGLAALVALGFGIYKGIQLWRKRKQGRGKDRGAVASDLLRILEGPEGDERDAADEVVEAMGLKVAKLVDDDDDGTTRTRKPGAEELLAGKFKSW
jgi:hypothetical protein